MAPARIQLTTQIPPDLPEALARHVPLQVILANYVERWKHFGLSLQLATADLANGRLETAILWCPGRHIRFPNGDIGPYMYPAPEGSEYIIHPPKRRLLTVNDPGLVYQHQFLLALGPNNSWWMVLAEGANAELALGELYFLVSIASGDRIFAPIVASQVADVRGVTPVDARVVEVVDKPLNSLHEAPASMMASRPPSKDPSLPKPDQTWLDATYKRLRAGGIIRPKMGKTPIAKALVRAMDLDPTVSPLTEGHVAASVEAWGYYPVR